MTADATPSFLRHAIDRILLAGKSMHLIESIGKLKHIQEGVVHSSPSKGGVVSSRTSGWDNADPPTPTDLYQDFVKSLALLGPPVRSCDTSCDTSRDRSPDPGKSGVGWKVTRLDHYDHLMNSYLKLIETNSVFYSPPDKWGVQDLSLPTFSLVPLNRLIQDSLYPLLQLRYETVSCFGATPIGHTHTIQGVNLVYSPGIWGTGRSLEVRVQLVRQCAHGAAVFPDGGRSSDAPVHRRGVQSSESLRPPLPHTSCICPCLVLSLTWFHSERERTLILSI